MDINNDIVYQGGEAVQVISGQHKGKKGYISRIDHIDGTLLIIDGIPETQKFRVSPSDIEILNTNFALKGYKLEENYYESDTYKKLQSFCSLNNFKIKRSDYCNAIVIDDNGKSIMLWNDDWE